MKYKITLLIIPIAFPEHFKTNTTIGIVLSGFIYQFKTYKELFGYGGYEEEIGIFFRDRPVFSTSIPNFDIDRRILGIFLKDNILLADIVNGKKDWLKKGKGQLVLSGFTLNLEPQHKYL